MESVAENTTDSFLGPWLSFAIAGLPGAFAYRAVNTLDSMIGYHGRYEYLGKVSAHLDDAVNVLPARLSAFLLVAAAALLGRSPRRAWAIMEREHARTESPNAGWTMAAMSGGLGISLEKRGHYAIGQGLREPGPRDVRGAVALASTRLPTG